MSIEELYTKLQADLKNMSEGIKEEQEEIKTEIKGIKEEQEEIKTEIKGIKEEQKSIRYRLDTIINVNLAQILNEQIKMRKEFTEIFMSHKDKNYLEHKEFDYRIAKLEVKN